MGSIHTPVQGGFQTQLPSPQRGRGAGGEGVARPEMDRLPFPEAILRKQSDESPPAYGENILLDLSPPRGISSVPFPKDNPPTREKIDLGRLLFFDRRLSSDESISCASCHNPEQAFADNQTVQSWHR